MSMTTRLCALLALIGAMIGVHWHGVGQGKRLERAEWQQKEIARQTSEKEAILARVETNRLLQKSNDEKTKRISDDYQSRLALLRADSAAARALRDPGISDSAAGSADSEVLGGCNGAIAGSGKLSEITQEFLWSEADRADAIVEQARALQGQARAHGFY
mgnify:CR=1 FL=1